MSQKSLWSLHLNKIRAENPGKSFKDLLHIASQSYPKGCVVNPKTSRCHLVKGKQHDKSCTEKVTAKGRKMCVSVHKKTSNAVVTVPVKTVKKTTKTDEFKKYYKNGNLKEHGFYKNGKKDGEYKKYYQNTGNLKAHGFYKNGVEDGEWKKYYDNGQLEAHGFQEDGFEIGEWKFYHENGQMSCNVFYLKYAMETGEYKEYYNNGSLKKIGVYEKGKAIGEWKYYHRNGQLKEIGVFNKGKATGEWKHYDANGKLIDTVLRGGH